MSNVNQRSAAADAINAHLCRIDRAAMRLWVMWINSGASLDTANIAWMDAQLAGLAAGLTELADRMERRVEGKP